MRALILLTIGVVLIFSLFILHKKRKKSYDYVLLMINIFLVAILYLNSLNLEKIGILSFVLHNILPFILHALLLVYAAIILNFSGHWFKKKWWFLLPPILFFIFILTDVLQLTPNFSSIVKARFDHPTITYHIFYKGHMLYAIITCTWLLQKIKTQFNVLKFNLSSLENLRFHWLKNFLKIIISVNILSILLFILYNVNVITSIEVPYQILNFWIIAAFLYMSFYGIKQYSLSEVMASSSGISDLVMVTDTPPPVNSQSQQGDNLDEAIFVNLKAYFETSKIFTEPQLKIADVAKNMGVQPYLLSQVINYYYGKPFYDFVGSYRVECLKNKLRNPENHKFTILALGLECGFNSKASLNRVFKEVTGTTPTQFQRSYFSK